MDTPLADRLRPSTIDEYIGQHHLTKDGEIIRQIIQAREPVSLILWGPPGSGKTTLARILAAELETDFIELSAVSAKKADITTVIERARHNWENSLRTLLFVDEIHRFNKAQQDGFLPYVETGLITLIGATTENPSFEVITPLLSRSKVIVLKPHSKKDIVAIISRALTIERATKRVSADAIETLAETSGGDARVALSNLELALKLAKNVTADTIKTAAQQRLPGYDKGGEYHFNLASAFIKSMRGGDTTATLYYLARMLAAGEEPTFIARRMIVFASEDIGLAGNGAMSLAVATYDAVHRVGMPECQYTLYHCATALSKSAKSREISELMGQAQALATRYPDAAVPLHLRNAPTQLMKSLGYRKGTEWKAGFVHPKGFLPEELPKKLDK